MLDASLILAKHDKLVTSTWCMTSLATVLVANVLQPDVDCHVHFALFAVAVHSFCAMLQEQSIGRSADGTPQLRSTVDSADLQPAPALKPLKINKNNVADLEAQGEYLC